MKKRFYHLLLLCVALPAYVAQANTPYKPPVDPDASWDSQPNRDSLMVGKMLEKVDPKQIPTRSIREKVADYIAASDAGISIDMFDVELLKGLGLSARYKYEVEAGYRQGYKLRKDTWRITGDLRIGDLLQDSMDTPLYINLRSDHEVVFLRHFQDGRQAALALPKTLKDLPLSADRATKSMHPGDFVSMPTTAKVAFGARFGYNQGFIAAHADMAYIVDGNFTFQVFRVNNSKFRLKVFAGDGRGTSSSTGVRFSLGVIGVDLLRMATKQIFDLDIIRAGTMSETGKILLVDYVFDFGYREAREAYDDILNSMHRFKNLEIAKRAFAGEDLSRVWISNMSKADELSRVDRNVPRPRVQRMFSGENAYSLRTTDFELGLLIANWRREKTYVENFITTFDLDGQASYYYNPAFVTYRKKRWGIKPIHLDEDTRNSVFAILDSSADAKSMQFRELGVSLDESDNYFDSDEQESMRKRVYLNLPDSIFSRIDWKGWGWNQSTVSFNSYRNSHLYFQFILGTETIGIIGKMSREEIHARMMKRFFDSPVYKDLDDVTSADVAKIADTVYFTVSDSRLSDKEKVANLLDLRNNNAFGLYGFGFIASLLNEEQLKRNVWVDIRLFADNAPDVRYQWGRSERNDVYEQLRLLDASTNWTRIDTRIFQP